MQRNSAIRHTTIGFSRCFTVGSARHIGTVVASRRLLLLGCTALMLGLSRPAAAGIGDWWDIYSGAAETEIRRLNKRADVSLAWHHSRRLFEIRQAMHFAIRGLKPPQIEALMANLDDPNQTLDDLRLPARDGRSTLSARETREQLGLPPDGLEQEGIAVIREKDALLVYHDIANRSLVRFGQEQDSAERLLSTLHHDIRHNPPVPARDVPVDSQLGQHMPMLIKGKKLFWHTGIEGTVCQPLLDRVTDTPTIGLCALYMPEKSRRNERVGECPNDQVGGVFETIHLINGEESSRSERWDDCVPKPPEGESQFEWVGHPERNRCSRAMHDVALGIIARSGIHNFLITGDYREERKEWTHTETFPKEWMLPPIVLTWYDPWIIKVDTCRATWNTRTAETGSRPDDRCTQPTQRTVTNHWRQSRTSAKMPDNPSVTRGDWIPVGPLDCPPPRYWTTSTTETGSHTVNGCTQARQRTVTSHWRLLGTPGSKEEVQRVTHGPWSDVGEPDCPPPPQVASRGGGGNNGGNNPGTTYDTTGDGITDSSRPGPAGHFGSVTGEIGTSTGWSDPSGYQAGGGIYGSGGGNNSRGSESRGASASRGGGISGSVSMGDSFDTGGGNGGSGGGGCFLTTQVVALRGEADDGPTLTMLRRFRDTFMANDPAMRREIKEYYRIAPKIIAANPPDSPVWDWIGDRIDAAIAAIDNGDNHGAYRIYRAMVATLIEALPEKVIT